MIRPVKKEQLFNNPGENLKKVSHDIIHATKKNDPVGVQLALKEDEACINNYDDCGMTALHWAAARNNYVISEILLGQPGVKKETLDNFGREPMHLALRKGSERLKELFFRNIFPEVYEQDDPYNSEKKVVDIRPKGTEPS
jgi:ankyrin repeat protein